jgi:preprotein translocase subunit SecD
LAILIDGDLISAPTMNSQVYDRATIFGGISKEKAEELANAIKCCVTDIKANRMYRLTGIKMRFRNINLEVRLAETKPSRGLKRATELGTEQRIFLHRNPLITNKDVTEARALKGMYEDTYEVEATLTSEAAARMGRASQEHIGKPLAILIDGMVVSVAIVLSELGERMPIVGRFTKEEAERIVERLNRKIRKE